MLIAFERHTIEDGLIDSKNYAFLGEHSLSNILDIIYSKLVFVNYDDEETFIKKNLIIFLLVNWFLVNYISAKLAKRV